jgi:hypothetical protein
MSDALMWFKSSYSNSEGGACVEVATWPRAIRVRDSKLGARGPGIGIDPGAWGAFIRRTAVG